MLPLTAMVVDDNRYFLRFVTQVLADHYTDLLEVQAACRTYAVIERCAALQPQVILLDLGLPGMTGLRFIAPLRQAAPATTILILSTENQAPYGEAARRAGASALLDKATLNMTLRVTITGLRLGFAHHPTPPNSATCTIETIHPNYQEDH